MAEHLAAIEGADVDIVRAAVLLHDAQGSLNEKNSDEPLMIDDHEGARAKHHHTSAAFASEILHAEGWPEERIAAVEHCIRAHRFRDESEQPQTIEAKILYDADKLDAIGAIGVARAVAYAATAGNPTYVQPSETFLDTGQTEPGESHSAYHEHLFKLSKLSSKIFTPTARAIAVERHNFMVMYFERLAEEMEHKQ
jgi:uncharacterized protein